ncbi:hypothetical protein N7527_000646 [Penicillium freii]|nr:hypothetical protein N7527_000646 [Penicillium freii]
MRSSSFIFFSSLFYSHPYSFLFIPSLSFFHRSSSGLPEVEHRFTGICEVRGEKFPYSPRLETHQYHEHPEVLPKGFVLPQFECTYCKDVFTREDSRREGMRKKPGCSTTGEKEACQKGDPREQVFVECSTTCPAKWSKDLPAAHRG